MDPRPGPITPGAPSSDLTFDVECRTNRRATRGRRHPFTIHGDWTVTTPHDLEAERVAAAFGGYSSCLELVDAGVPALRELVALGSRRQRADLIWDRAWRVPRLDTCGCPASFASASAAAEHARSVRHVAARFGCAERVVRSVATMVLDLVPDVVPPRRHPAAHLVREAGGVAELWDAGVHPDDLVAMAGWVPAVRDPLPVRFYLGLAYRAASPGVLAASAARPDADTAAWLAWLDPQWGDRGPVLAAWLALGLARGDVLDLVTQGYELSAVEQVAAASGIEVARAARVLAQWGRVGCRLSSRHLRLLVAEGLETYRPSGPALDVLVAEARGHRVERTELGVMLAVADTRAGILAAVRDGVRLVDEMVGAGGPDGFGTGRTGEGGGSSLRREAG